MTTLNDLVGTAGERFTLPADPDEIFDYFYKQGWTDGLPIMPPTEAAIERMLAGTRRKADEIVGVLPPSREGATVLLVAINAVMAGCRPEYFPVVLAAIEAIADPKFNLFSIQATTNPITPLLVVNGPLARELEFNAKGNCLGNGWRANATVGRAVRLCMLNIGGGIPQEIDKATHGQPGKFSMCIAENEEESPWEPYSAEHGFAAGTSTVAAFSVTGTQNMLDLASPTAYGLLRTFASSCATVGAQNVQLGGGPLILLCPEHAATIASGGFSKREVSEFLYETARVPVHDFPPETLDAMSRHRRPKRYRSEHPLATIPIADSPDDIRIVVAGGPGLHSVYLPSFGPEVQPTIKPILTEEKAS